jgi:hypothetical protein
VRANARHKCKHRTRENGYVKLVGVLKSRRFLSQNLKQTRDGVTKIIILKLYHRSVGPKDDVMWKEYNHESDLKDATGYIRIIGSMTTSETRDARRTTPPHYIVNRLLTR